MTVCITQNNGIWLGTLEGGIFVLDTIRNSFKQIYESNVTINRLYQDSSGFVWAGLGEGGLLCFDPKDNSMQQFKSDPADTSTLSGNIVWSFCEDNEKNLWIGTNNGLSRYNPESGTFTNFYKNKPVLTILKDNDKYLWISTNKNISRFSPSTGQFKNYDFFNESKIVFNFGTGCNAENGELYFGGKGGFIRFNPKNIKGNTFIPPIVITSFRKFEKPYPFSKSIELNYTENFLSFEFAALSFINPGKNQYAYKMEGVDKDWVYSGTRRFASYPNLDPGEYVFRVKGSNNDGVWNEKGTSIAIIISPPLWKTWWAYTFYGFFFVFALYGLRRYEMNRLSFKNQVKLMKLFERKRRNR